MVIRDIVGNVLKTNTPVVTLGPQFGTIAEIRPGIDLSGQAVVLVVLMFRPRQDGVTLGLIATKNPTEASGSSSENEPV